jgi:hypothetical protein
MSCFLCNDEEVVTIRGDVYNRSYPCPECRIVSYHVAYDLTGFDMKQLAEPAEETIDEIRRNLRDRLLAELIEKAGESHHVYEVSEDKHKFSARVRVVLPLIKESQDAVPAD